ncbi:TonB-dependent receptor [Flavobacterium oreochromis]|uniref:TonB-dependent receptor n=1 Tax=Flavobacterium columnare TaxID=996 RepID=A0A246GE69_9FLAO|nr:TonB-dependent receptor [Flavobacterium oreochromis]OWP79688.1 TonB-dependent receptor [Flavobacterium oreochromis]POR30766.1 TonB-dependent receptor [Flavobacterium columnare]
MKNSNHNQTHQLLSKIILSTFILMPLNTILGQEKKVTDSTKMNALEEIKVASTRLSKKSPFAFSDIKKEALERNNLGQDLPILLDQMTSVVATSDAGAGVGYTGLRIRGSDATRINVTINGIPYNDAESQGTFWVNMPDFATSVQNIQLQRGAGTSTNGAGAFGASLNLRTMTPAIDSYATTSHSIGSFNTRKHNITFGSGIKNGFYAEGRLSKIASNGYIDRASSDLKSFYTEAGFIGKQTAIKALVFGGKEITYQSWNGTPESVLNGDLTEIKAFINRNDFTPAEIDNLLNSTRTFNHYLYDNQVDNYEQTHYQLHLTHQFSEHLKGTISGNFTKGKGYYEEFKADQKLKKYFPDYINGNSKSDVVRRKWLDNDFYAVVYALNYNTTNFNGSLGGGYNQYDGIHFGELIKHKYIDLPVTNMNYYKSLSKKEDFSVYAKADYTFFYKLQLFLDIQARRIDYITSGLSSDLKPLDIKKTYEFFNPKGGINFAIHKNHHVYSSFAVANKEPNRNDLTKNPIEPKSEQLLDYELGYRFKNKIAQINLNGYYMHYNNQLVLTGALDEVGDAIRENVDKSHRIGVEVEASIQPVKFLKLDFNITKSRNKIKSFDYSVPSTEYDLNGNEIHSTQITKYENTDISFSPSIIGGATVTFYPTKNLSIACIQKYVGKQYLDNTSSENKKLNNYQNSNLSILYILKPKNFAEISFNLLINNIFNKLYESNGYTYSYYSRPQGSNNPAITENFYYPQAGRNFLTGITLKF